MSDLPKKVALITGATRGIGLAIAEKLAPDFQLIIGGQDPEKTEMISESFEDAIPFATDLTNPEQLGSSLQAVLEPVQRLDVLVNNAGITRWAPLEAATLEDWHATFDLNVYALAELTRNCLPFLRASRGLIVNINSGSGLRVSEGYGVYSASKFALKAYTDTLRLEEGDRIRVTSVHPGRVSTDMQRRIEHDAGSRYRRGSELNPDTVAAAVRLAVDLPSGASINEITIRPSS